MPVRVSLEFNDAEYRRLVDACGDRSARTVLHDLTMFWLRRPKPTEPKTLTWLDQFAVSEHVMSLHRDGLAPDQISELITDGPTPAHVSAYLKRAGHDVIDCASCREGDHEAAL